MAKNLPVVPTAVAGGAAEVSTASSWRELRPEIRAQEKVNPEVILFCPDGAISYGVDRAAVNLHLCKGCGICAVESDGIVMVAEYTGAFGVFGVKEVNK